MKVISIFAIGVLVVSAFAEIPKISEMVKVEEVTFDMGDASGKRDYRDVHSVTLSPFMISKKLLIQNFSNDFNYNGRFTEAVLICNELSKANGLDTVYSYSEVKKSTTPGGWESIVLKDLEIDINKTGYRLPTEAEWEYSMKQGIIQKASESSDASKSKIVEWVNDYYGAKYYSKSPQKDPLNTKASKMATIQERVKRGKDGSSTQRRHGPESSPHNFVGGEHRYFRVVKSIR